MSADSPKSPVTTPPIQSKYWVSRAVESEVGADLGQPLGRDLGAGDDHGEVAGDQAQQGEHDDAGDQQGEHQQAESPDQEPRHSSVPSRFGSVPAGAPTRNRPRRQFSTVMSKASKRALASNVG